MKRHIQRGGPLDCPGIWEKSANTHTLQKFRHRDAAECATKIYGEFHVSTWFPQKHPLIISEAPPLKDGAIKTSHTIRYKAAVWDIYSLLAKVILFFWFSGNEIKTCIFFRYKLCGLLNCTAGRLFCENMNSLLQGSVYPSHVHHLFSSLNRYTEVRQFFIFFLVTYISLCT